MVSGIARSLVAAALLAVPGVVEAQGDLLVGTGVSIVNGRDVRWSVSQDGSSLLSGVPMTVALPGVTPVPGQYNWISANATGSFIRPNFTDRYTARTIFTLGAGDRISITMLCAVKDTPLGIWINGTQVRSGDACGGANDSGFGPAQTFTDFLAGTHVIDVKWSGDGTADGLIVSMTYVLNGPQAPPTGVVPEPSTWVLMLSGFGMLAIVARQRRRVQ